MASFVASTAMFLGIYYIDVRPMRRAGERKAFTLGWIVLILGYALLSLSSFGLVVPSPIVFVERLLGVL